MLYCGWKQARWQS